MKANIIVEIAKWFNSGVKILGIALATFIFCLHIHVVRNVVQVKGGVTVIDYQEQKGKNFYLVEYPDKKLYAAIYDPKVPLRTVDGQKIKPGKIKILKQIKPYMYKGITLVDTGDCPAIFGTKGWSLLYQNRIDKKKQTIAGLAKELFVLTLILSLLIKAGEFLVGRIYFLNQQILASTANYLILDVILFMIAAFLVAVIVY
ncbi:MAG: hypothetical protein J6L86_07470 [Alphaproteobacteria bacterium]|nr:hypothetical protein [Alphaproteobacteria bacterium]